MDNLSKSTGCDRSSYHFISSTGYRTLASDAVDDMVVYVVPGEALPFNVSFDVDADTLVMSIQTADMSPVASVKYGDSMITGEGGDIRGFIAWNNHGCTILKSTILANDPQPWDTLYVDPYACVPHKPLSLSAISINGEPLREYDVTISCSKDSTLHVDTDNSINLYRDYSGESTGINRVIFNDAEGNTVLDTGKTTEISGHIIIKPSAESDIRVVTQDVITITEVTNDNI